MRFLLDESADFTLANRLKKLGHDVTAVAHDYPQALEDFEVLAIAVREQRILITNDLDFGELIFRQRLPHTGVILLRLEAFDLPAKIARIDGVLADYADQLGNFVVLTERGIRVRRSPS
jgi:predicted nuclease of predicted toxin-antitoxin system